MVQRLGILLLCASTSALPACAPLSDDTSTVAAYAKGDGHQYGPSAAHLEDRTVCCKRARPCCGLSGRIFYCDSMD